MKHLRQHPEAPHYAAASKLQISLLAAFPCKNSDGGTTETPAEFQFHFLLPSRVRAARL
jgi:hypothetical protein